MRQMGTRRCRPGADDGVDETGRAMRMTALASPTTDRFLPGAGEERRVSSSTWRAFAVWTAIFWGATAIFAALFYLGVLDFTTSTKTSLYGISIWLNGWFIPLLLPGARKRPRMALFHECLVLWMVSYAITNLLWEIPWVIFSPFVFHDLHTLGDIVAYTPWLRENVLHMYWWDLASFGSVDLRTVNHNPTFFTLEIYAFGNIAGALAFWRLNKRRSPMRYLIPVLGAGEPVVATFIFSFSEVFGGFKNMAGGVADTLLALAWTQYQYFVFPLVFGWLGCKLLYEDWRRLSGSTGPARVSLNRTGQPAGDG
ncbi:hypothetical protein [Mycobacterium pseudoshottsii]|uniref:Uncharacterized protein n=3 Tax=Mycobacteriaceae TaxID=1762 RepID=A0A9N7QLP9_9MYCO|nr:hypothetical protein [Mycobacterium pseudoshottsii]MBC9861107.1 hypothetical protein [Mycobacterium pseudoshottsii]BBA88994.1 hypothetical protein MPSD_35830 [Mycobacterium pseudoshottsii JCM 15466]BDN83303.1 hypothetical protein NJB1907Z4_C35180 [Mycobacterium pseudoshottsii]BEH77693.1 hypothetical protein YM3MPS_34960 [Mycobacterium pseudoshottsii]